MISNLNFKAIAPVELISSLAKRLINKNIGLKKFCNILVLALVVTLPNSLLAKPVNVLMYGDSISAGYGMTTPESWPYLLNETFKSEKLGINLINASISGETTGGGLARLPAELKRHNLSADDWLLIELGGNDGLRGFPVTTVSNNLTKMIQIAQQQGIKVAIMQVRIPPNYGKRYTSMLEALYPQMAQQFQLPLLPFFMDKVALNPNYMQDDGIHPNVSAQVIIRDIMKPEIVKLIN